jgi:excinuclease ABC subunit B
VRELTMRLTGTHEMAESRASYGSSKSTLMPKSEFTRLIGELENQMKASAKELQFEKAATIRDQIYELKALYAETAKVPPWEKARLMSGEE